MNKTILLDVNRLILRQRVVQDHLDLMYLNYVLYCMYEALDTGYNTLKKVQLLNH